MNPTTTAPASSQSHSRRFVELRRLLEERRREVERSMREQLSLVRAERAGADRPGVLDDWEVADIDVQEEIELVLMQLRRETIERIDDALARLEAGVYGRCVECGHDISEARLWALPFAGRCIECEKSREIVLEDARGLARRFPQFADPHLHTR
jgi:RNA polymerase-binding transcription factor